MSGGIPDRGSLLGLQRLARGAAERRGHTLGAWQDAPRNVWRERSYAECECGAWVAVDTQPPANGIDIGGSAVAVSHPIGEADR